MAREFNPYPMTSHGVTDRRYQISLEYCGYEQPRFVARFMTDSHNGEWIGQSQFYSSALMLLAGYKAKREGALIIEAA